MAKIVYNACYGVFSLSEKAIALCTERGLKVDRFGREVDRASPILAQVVEELGGDADGGFADLQIAEVASGVKYRIDEYDGLESVMTVDDYEWSVAP